MLDHRIHNVIRVTWTQLFVGMFECGVIPEAFLTSTFALADKANASLTNFNQFTKRVLDVHRKIFVISYNNFPFFTLDMTSFLTDGTVCSS